MCPAKFLTHLSEFSWLWPLSPSIEAGAFSKRIQGMGILEAQEDLCVGTQVIFSGEVSIYQWTCAVYLTMVFCYACLTDAGAKWKEDERRNLTWFENKGTMQNYKKRRVGSSSRTCNMSNTPSEVDMDQRNNLVSKVAWEVVKLSKRSTILQICTQLAVVFSAPVNRVLCFCILGRN